MKPTSEQILRLPKWAQSYIDQLEKKVEMARREREAAGWQLEPTSFCLARTDFSGPGLPHESFQPLLPYDSIRIGNIEVKAERDGGCEVRSIDGIVTVQVTSEDF